VGRFWEKGLYDAKIDAEAVCDTLTAGGATITEILQNRICAKYLGDALAACGNS